MIAGLMMKEHNIHTIHASYQSQWMDMENFNIYSGTHLFRWTAIRYTATIVG